jgi:hypothetical protein
VIERHCAKADDPFVLRRISVIAATLFLLACTTGCTGSSEARGHSCGAMDKSFIATASVDVTALGSLTADYQSGLAGPEEVAQEAFDAYDPGELGIEPLRFEHAFYCRRCAAMATSRTCPHPAETRVHLSGTAVRNLLGRGQLPPPEFSRPEVARLLADGYRARRG